MKENLKTKKFNDCTYIPNSLTRNRNPGYAWYNNDNQYKDIYGALYNWHAVNTNK